MHISEKTHLIQVKLEFGSIKEIFEKSRRFM